MLDAQSWAHLESWGSGIGCWGSGIRDQGSEILKPRRTRRSRRLEIGNQTALGWSGNHCKSKIELYAGGWKPTAFPSGGGTEGWRNDEFVLKHPIG